jgi:dTDP-4-dehydrorhamnose reductase
MKGIRVTQLEGVSLPRYIDDESMLDEVLSRPSAGLVESVGKIEGDIVILGVGGKMGPTLALLLKRALNEAGASNNMLAVSRFGSGTTRQQFEDAGIETLAADLLDPAQLESVPRMPNVIYLVGMKFGATGQEDLTWAMNTYLPGMVAQHFRGSRIVALSTGNVYPLVSVSDGGSREGDLTNPVGDYAQSCLGRERMFRFWTAQTGSPLCLVRLNYAAELRYGVLVDVARQVYNGDAVDVTMGHLNCVWQGYANEVVIRALEIAGTPPRELNLTGPETLSVRRLARKFAERFDVEPGIVGEEAPTALLNDASECFDLFGYPSVSIDRLIEWIAHWTQIDGPTLNKPTKFQTRDGKF